MRNNSRMVAAVAAGLLMFAAAAQGQSAKPGRTAKPGKPQAPVEIAASIRPSDASLSITFKAAAEQVTVKVYGTDGLVVSGTDLPVDGGSFKQGETLSLTVAYTPGPGQGNLAVAVNGQFAGSQRSRIASFTVGDKAASVLRSTARGTVDEKGRRIIVLPAKDK